MNKSISCCVALAAVSLALIGCANKEQQLEGKWKFKSNDLPASVASSPMAAMAKSQLANASLEVKPDKTYSLAGSGKLEGSWVLSGSTVTLTPKTINGQPIADFIKTLPAAYAPQLSKLGNPMTATLSDDGKTLTITGLGGSANSLALEKASS